MRPASCSGCQALGRVQRPSNLATSAATARRAGTVTGPLAPCSWGRTAGGRLPDRGRRPSPLFVAAAAATTARWRTGQQWRGDRSPSTADGTHLVRSRPPPHLGRARKKESPPPPLLSAVSQVPCERESRGRARLGSQHLRPPRGAGLAVANGDLLLPGPAELLQHALAPHPARRVAGALCVVQQAPPRSRAPRAPSTALHSGAANGARRSSCEAMRRGPPPRARARTDGPSLDGVPLGHKQGDGPCAHGAWGAGAGERATQPASQLRPAGERSISTTARA
eukprot:scaffold3980_cov348-Prasinococcus_capsulatus_cf.AAC.7